MLKFVLHLYAWVTKLPWKNAKKSWSYQMKWHWIQSNQAHTLRHATGPEVTKAPRVAGGYYAHSQKGWVGAEILLKSWVTGIIGPRAQKSGQTDLLHVYVSEKLS